MRQRASRPTPSVPAHFAPGQVDEDLLGLGVMVTGLRPRSPLPPEPSAYTTGSVPLASRTDDEVVLRVRDDSPPR